jgi:hypothetical protein
MPSSAHTAAYKQPNTAEKVASAAACASAVVCCFVGIVLVAGIGIVHDDIHAREGATVVEVSALPVAVSEAVLASEPGGTMTSADYGEENGTTTGEQQIGSAGGSLEPPGPLLEPPGPLPMRLPTVHMECSGCLPALLNPLAERTCFSQAATYTRLGSRARTGSMWSWMCRRRK